MNTITANLGTGTLQTGANSPFSVPPQQWKNINTFLTGVNGASPTTTASFVSLMPAYADLSKCAALWRSTTFPNLIALARDISQYGTQVANVVYPKLGAMVQNWAATSPTKDQQSAFTQLLSPSIDAARRNGQFAGALATQLQALDTAVTLTNQQLPGAISNLMANAMGDPGSTDPDSLVQHLVDQINAVAGQLAELASLLSAVGQQPPVADIQRVQGAWGGIASDLDGLYKNVLSQIANEQPFIANLDLQVAISEWSSIASEAQAFAGSVGSAAAAA